MRETRLKLGQFWKEQIAAKASVPKGIDSSHSYILEYEASLIPEAEPEVE